MAKKLVKLRRQAFIEWNEGVGTKEDYKTARKAVKKQLASEGKEKWKEFIEKGSTLLAEGNWRGAWKWAKGVSNKSAGSKINPIKVGERLVCGEELVEEWGKHYV